jgi:hypothetical protein
VYPLDLSNRARDRHIVKIGDVFAQQLGAQVRAEIVEVPGDDLLESDQLELPWEKALAHTPLSAPHHDRICPPTASLKKVV